MASRTDYLIGCRIPTVKLSELRDGEVVSLTSIELLGRGRVLAAGAPEASGPIGYGHYLRGLIAHAGRLRNTGFQEIVCIVTDDPVAVDGWSKSLDPARKVRFVSDPDPDREFARALDLIAPGRGDRSEHYVLTLRDGLIETARIEHPAVQTPSPPQDDPFMLDV